MGGGMGAPPSANRRGPSTKLDHGIGGGMGAPPSALIKPRFSCAIQPKANAVVSTKVIHKDEQIAFFRYMIASSMSNVQIQG